MYALEATLFAEPNFFRFLDTAPNDTHWDEQWNLHDDDNGIGAEFAWYASPGSNTVRIGIIDTGISYDHWDLGWPPPHQPDYKYGGGYDYTDRDSDPYDYIGHGTACAGVIGACTNNGMGVAGVAGGWCQFQGDVGAKLYSLKIFRDDYYPVGSAIIAQAIHEAADPNSFGCHILNNSYGSYAYAEVIRAAINFAYRLGVSFVASKGNDGLDDPTYPATYDDSWVTAVASYGKTATTAKEM